MAKDTTPKPPEIHIDSRSGDKPGEILGHVVPGKDLRQRMGLAPKAEVPPEKKEGKLPEDTPVAVAPAAPPKDEKTGKFVKKPKTAPVTSAVDPEALSAAVVAGVKAALPEKEKPTAPAPVDPLAGMKPALKRKYEVLKQMGESDGGDKGLADRWLVAERKTQKYQSEWEAKNPGKKFNRASDEHNDFFDDVELEYDLDEYAEAEGELIKKMAKSMAAEEAKAAMKPLEDRLKQEDDARKEQARVIELAPQVAIHAKATAKVLFGKLGDEYKNLLDEGGNVVKSELDKLLQKDTPDNPINQKIFNLAAKTEMVAGELKKIGTGLTKFRENPPARSAFKTKQEFEAELSTYLLHMDIAEFAIEQDSEMAKESEEERQNQHGQMFATMEEWNKLTPKQRESRWFLTDADLSVFYAIRQAKEAKKIIASAKKPDAPAPAAPPARATAPARQPEDRSPSGAVAAIAPKTAQVANGKQNGINSLLKRATG